MENEAEIAPQRNDQSQSLASSVNRDHIYDDIYGRSGGISQTDNASTPTSQGKPGIQSSFDYGKSNIEHPDAGNENNAAALFCDEYRQTTPAERSAAAKIALQGPALKSRGFPDYDDLEEEAGGTRGEGSDRTASAGRLEPSREEKSETEAAGRPESNPAQQTTQSNSIGEDSVDEVTVTDTSSAREKSLAEQSEFMAGQVRGNEFSQNDSSEGLEKEGNENEYSTANVSTDQNSDDSPRFIGRKIVPEDGTYRNYSDGSVTYKNEKHTWGYSQSAPDKNGQVFRNYWGPNDRDYVKETYDKEGKLLEKSPISRDIAYDKMIETPSDPKQQPSPEFKANVRSELDKFPRPVVEELAEKGTKIFLAKSVESLGKDFEQFGLKKGNRPEEQFKNFSVNTIPSLYSPKINKMLIAENYADSDTGKDIKTVDNAFGLNGLLEHEASHALVALGGYMGSSRMAEAWAEDVKRMGPEQKEKFSYMIQSDTARGLNEAAAYLTQSSIFRQSKIALWDRGELNRAFESTFDKIDSFNKKERFGTHLLTTE